MLQGRENAQHLFLFLAASHSGSRHLTVMQFSELLFLCELPGCGPDPLSVSEGMSDWKFKYSLSLF